VGLLDRVIEEEKPEQGFLGRTLGPPTGLLDRAAAAPADAFATPALHKDLGDLAVDLLADQLDPFNLLLLASGYGLAAKLGKAVPAVKAVGALTRTGAPILEANYGRRVLHRLATGLGWSLPFASVELFEEPREGGSRIGEFAQSLLVFEALELGFMGLGGAGSMALKGVRGHQRILEHRAVAETFNRAVQSAEARNFSRNEAIDAALADMLTSKVATIERVIGKPATADLLQVAQTIASKTPQELTEAGLASSFAELAVRPEIFGGFKQLGIPIESLVRLPEAFRKEAAEAAAAVAEKEAAKLAELATQKAAMHSQIIRGNRGLFFEIPAKKPGDRPRTRALVHTPLDLTNIEFTAAAREHYSQSDLDLLSDSIRDMLGTERAGLSSPAFGRRVGGGSGGAGSLTAHGLEGIPPKKAPTKPGGKLVWSRGTFKEKPAFNAGDFTITQNDQGLWLLRYPKPGAPDQSEFRTFKTVGEARDRAIALHEGKAPAAEAPPAAPEAVAAAPIVAEVKKTLKKKPLVKKPKEGGGTSGAAPALGESTP